MKKQLSAAITLLAVGVLFSAIPAAAQGRSDGHGAGGAAVAASHEPMGMGDAMSSSHGNGNMANHSSASGPKTAGDLLSQNTKLASNLQNLLPSGTDLQTASQGFKNLGQFVAAVHVSHNLSIPFDCLKADMTDTAPPPTATCPAGTGTGAKSLSLGASIEALKPTVNKSDAQTAAKTGEQQAKSDMSHS